MYLTPEQNMRRFEILGMSVPEKWFGGTCAFESMTAEMGRLLIEEGLMNPEGTQNYSPTNEEFVQFLKENPEFTAHGYIVSPERSDVRISIEGVRSGVYPERDSILKFVEMFRDADSFEIDDDGMYCWFD